MPVGRIRRSGAASRVKTARLRRLRPVAAEQIGGGALRVEIPQQGATRGQRRRAPGEVHRERGLSDAALGTVDRDRAHG